MAIKQFFNLGNILIISILLIGIIFKLYSTWGGNFIFNMDNARDFVDVREMVELKKLRLIGPTSAIEGVYDGPAWYYLLAIPYLTTGGDPYSAIVLQILLWALGGFFLLKLSQKYGYLAILSGGLVWIASNFITLTTSYSFNPNPVTLLAPLFIYLLVNLLITNKLWLSLSTWCLAGLFFNFEMNVGIFMPLIIISSLVLTRNLSFIRLKNFWLGLLAFSIFLLPQVMFDIKHQFIMSRSLLKFLTDPALSHQTFNPLTKFPVILQKFYNTLLPVLMNNQILAKTSLILVFLLILSFIRAKTLGKNFLLPSVMMAIAIPLLGYTILPITVNPWHLGFVAVCVLVLLGPIMSMLKQSLFGKLTLAAFGTILFIQSSQNILGFFQNVKSDNSDPSEYINEIKAIDYVYQQAQGKNFKVYTYLPSVYDYPYQYLFWWYGKNHYGYIPFEYAYLPYKPNYIPSKPEFSQTQNFDDSHLIFLIKEPDRIGYRKSWEDNFKNQPLITRAKFATLEIDTKKDQP